MNDFGKYEQKLMRGKMPTLRYERKNANFEV